MEEIIDLAGAGSNLGVAGSSTAPTSLSRELNPLLSRVVGTHSTEISSFGQEFRRPSHEKTSTFVSTAVSDEVPSSLGYVPDKSDEKSYIASQQELQNLSGFIDFIPPLNVRELDLERYCRAMDRIGTHSRGGSLLITCTLHSAEAYRCAGLYHLTVGRTKIRTELKKARNKARVAAAKNNLLKGLSFDGKRNKTLKTIPGTSTNRIQKEEHVVLVKEPRSKYIGYVAPQENGHTSSKALPTVTTMLQYLKDENYSLDFLVAISCDGTNTNVGLKGGIIFFIERQLQRPLQWIVCLFHFNELL